MTDQQAYAKGLRKLGVFEPPSHKCTYACVGLADFPEGHQPSFDIETRWDLRSDRAFAWRVLCALITPNAFEGRSELLREWFEAIWHDMANPADQLYAAVVALGREES